MAGLCYVWEAYQWTSTGLDIHASHRSGKGIENCLRHDGGCLGCGGLALRPAGNRRRSRHGRGQPHLFPATHPAASRDPVPVLPPGRLHGFQARPLDPGSRPAGRRAGAGLGPGKPRSQPADPARDPSQTTLHADGRRAPAPSGNRPPQPVDLGRRPLPRGRDGRPVPGGRQASLGAETLCRAGEAALRIHLSEMPLTGDQGFRTGPLQPGGHAGRR